MIRQTSPGVIGISERNPHYFQYKGREILLITSAEHYGAVISKKFDYVKYFDALAEYNLNYTRIYPGAFVECAGVWLPEDNMAPGLDLTVPWARSDTPGYIGGGNKFDLERWDDEYFKRLRDFLSQADKRNIIVEICFFNCMDDRFWPYSPLHGDSNIQGIGHINSRDFQTLDDKDLVREQMKYIRKIITETNDFDNIIYEFVDEPTLFMTPVQKVYHWISAQIDTAIETEEKLPKKHMLAQQMMQGMDFSDDDRLSLPVSQYVFANSHQLGGLVALMNCYRFNKPIELNETAYIASWINEFDTDLVSVSRLEAWEFMIGGGAAFNQLNGYFIVSNPSGENAVNRKIMQGLKNLRAFMESFDFIKMTRDTVTIRKISPGTSVSMISQRGKQYAAYLHHSFLNVGPFYQHYYDPNFGEYETVITLGLEKGSYSVQFINPATLDVIGECKLESHGEDVKLTCPKHALDLAVKIIAE